ncbi:hypothetical protein B7L17_023670 [Burkholderia cenocepacia]|uniref:hypothetical protein n=1 Tax=Burkholderia cenocepacia TaxID=95486 RepID=UPI001B9F33DC|nr:hypothetical protein [Burkholderia cenocepacia]MBR8432331.1 hypothetical protein [Burkholderia cenocepacia]MCW5118465.1 hypothetical protein [Burkholderia cenocepacia]MCW5133279.1 hypothetical protein [Burkholderia cenocepacia]MCW5171893.1 hypothetical protein [Burkholderia cenocepacia]MDN7625827.1 hypothetical protein [Burkholderia cenocepacia]
MNAVVRLRDDPPVLHGISPAARARLSGMCRREVERCRFLFEDDRIDGDYLVCVILCNVIELMQKRSLLYEQWRGRKAVKALWGGALVV